MRGIALACLMVLGFGLTGCMTVGKQQGGLDNFDVVSPTVYRGGQPSVVGLRTLAATYHVKTIINLRDDADPREAEAVRAAGMTYIHMPLDAETVTAADAEKFLTLLDNAPKPVFVHCFVGRDRTGMAVAAYRVREQGWTVKDAVADMNAHGHFWMWFPKVRGAVEELAALPRVEVVEGAKTTVAAPVP